jgi:hypothetical protein
LKVKKRGRPKRYFLSSSNPGDRERARIDLEIALVVYEAVLSGKPYRDGINDLGALSEGVKKAKDLGIALTQDGVEVLMDRIRQDDESLLRTPPTQLRDTLAKLAAGFLPEKAVTLTAGDRTRVIGPNTKIRGAEWKKSKQQKGVDSPKAETDEPEAGEPAGPFIPEPDRPGTNEPRLKIRKNPPGT